MALHGLHGEPCFRDPLVSQTPFDFDCVEVRDVSKHQSRRRALAHVSLTGRGGEILGLLGPNGAGKSTLLNVLATLMHPTSGEVRYGGKLSREIGDALRGRIGLLGHDLFLYGDLSAREESRILRPAERRSAAPRAGGSGPRRRAVDGSVARARERIFARAPAATGARARAHPRSATRPAGRAIHGLGRRLVHGARGSGCAPCALRACSS